MKKSLKKITSNKRIYTIGSFITLILLLSILNFTFSSFTNRKFKNISNIQVNEMEYSININGNQTTMITAENKKTINSNIVITSLNSVDSKYELIYKVCTDLNCNNVVDKPDDLLIEYSSKTIDPVNGSINKNGAKIIRIIIVNETNQTYYIKLDMNAGYVHNTLSLKKLIATEYNEEDIIIAATINGEISTTFPSIKGDYETTVTCVTNNQTSNAIGVVSWNGTKWILNVSGIDSGRTVCNINFFIPFKNILLSKEGGSSAIEAKGSPNYGTIATLEDTGLYATEDEYGISYYYRGLRSELKNNLLFGGFQWKIVRINGDGSIRLIYNGTEERFNTTGIMESTGHYSTIGSSRWNISAGDAKYVGYMFGGANGNPSTVRNGNSSEAATYNETSSSIKIMLDNWYMMNITGKLFENNITDNLFCNERQLSSEVGGSATGPGYGSSTSLYALYVRMTKKTPTLKCKTKNDRFTVNDLSLGNGALTYPVGILTIDEAMMAGLDSNYLVNNGNYLRTDYSQHLMSPIQSEKDISIRVILNNGNIAGYADYEFYVRPIINISSSVKVTGEGTETNPYLVHN